MEDIIVKHEERYLPEKTYGILLPSVVPEKTAYRFVVMNCTIMRKSRIEKNSIISVNHVIGEYIGKEQRNWGIPIMKIEKYELGLERKYERREETYMVPMMK